MTNPIITEESASQDIPRFVLTVTDTKTTMQGPNGDQYMSISVGADALAQFNRPLPKADRTPQYKTELQKLFVYFQEQVDKADEQGNEFTQVPLEKDSDTINNED